MPTLIDGLVDSYLADYATLNPIAATNMGVPGHEDALPDLSPEGLDEISALRRRTLAELADTRPEGASDRITATAFRDQAEVAESIRATGAEESCLNNLESPVQTIRQVFDLMATSTADDWAVVATRLNRVPAALDGYRASLAFAAAGGTVSPRRQVLAGIVQSRENTGPDGFFAQFVRNATTTDGDLPRSLRADLDRAGQAAADAYHGLAEYLSANLMSQAPTRDAVGTERYRLFSRSFLGTSVDLEETYHWGQDELARLVRQLDETADRVEPGSTPHEAMGRLSADPARILHGVDGLRTWMQDTTDAAISALAGTHFDIPGPLRALECRIAPTSGGIYYTGPSEDFSRPGRMWWSVAPGATEFATWRELATLYHEGVPGHHLQMAQTVYRSDLLSRWRRLGSWVSGHGEGWALYAERLMAELGFLDDPGDYLGLLASQSFRAVRVVIDIGYHCGFAAPAEVGGGEWTNEKAFRLLSAHSVKSPDRLRYELDRYLGLPGQAPSYKIGERFWLDLRAEIQMREGTAFDRKAFHRRALDIGGVGLDVLRSAVLGQFDG